MLYFSEDWKKYDMLCIVGPTASGKTAFAVDCANRVGDAQIISADSRQVYRGMDIGTGKDLNEYKGVKYHLIDIVDAGEKYDLFQYKRDFTNAYNLIVSNGSFPILCGGSGLYVEAVCKGYSLKEIRPHPELRRKLEERSLEQLGEIIEMLKRLNNTQPHNTTDFDTKKRASRAIEIDLFSIEDRVVLEKILNEIEIDKSLADSILQQWSVNHSTYSKSPNSSLLYPHNIKVVALNPSREERNRRIDQRLDYRLQNGLIEEVRGLLDRGISDEDLIYYGLEYKFVTQFIRGDFSYQYMREHLAIAIHQFAKRQMTWLRGMEKRGVEIEWIEC